MKFTRRHLLTLGAAGLCRAAAEDRLLDEWRLVASGIDGTVGAAALHLETGWHASLNGGERFPLASVCKLPVAMNILALIDEGKLRRDQQIEIPLYDVVPWVSDIAERWPRQKRFPVEEMLRLMVAASDNTAVQTLFRLGGGAAGMSARFRQWGIDGMRLDRSELQANLDSAGVLRVPPVAEWTPGMFERLTAAISPADRLAEMRRFLTDPRDTATPDATVRLLVRTFRGELLSKGCTALLIEILESTATGKGRIRGLLPTGTVVAHKTGTTTTVSKLNGATNDAGVVTLPGGAGRLAIAVYIKGSTREQADREAAIARIAKAAFDSRMK